MIQCSDYLLYDILLKMDRNTRKNLKHLIGMFEARVNTAEEGDVADIGDIAEITREAYNLAIGKQSIKYTY